MCLKKKIVFKNKSPRSWWIIGRTGIMLKVLIGSEIASSH